MADLTGDERGQLILVAAFALAVIFVSMALIVNSAIFTENLASRGEVAGSNGALDSRAMVEANVGDAVAAANRYNTSSDSALTGAVTTSIGEITAQQGRTQARSGRVLDVAYVSSTPGRRIYQGDGSNFTNDLNQADYTVVGGVSRAGGANGTRAFEINASAIPATTNASAFEITVQRTGAPGNERSWRARVYRGGPDTLRIRTLTNDGTTTEVADCAVTRDSGVSTFRIDITGGTVNGEPCYALRRGPGGDGAPFGAGTGVTPGGPETYDIRFENADDIEGNFSMVVYDGATSSLDLTALGSAPTSTDALYGVTVRYTYTTSDLQYETNVRVARGEPDA